MKLRTRIQLSTTVVLMILLIMANTSIYLIFQNRTIASEEKRLIHTSHNIVKELNTNRDASMQPVLEAYLISDGIIRTVDSSNHPIRQVTTDDDYLDIKSTYNNDQIEDAFSYEESMFIMVSIPMIDENGEVINLQIVENVDFLFDTIHDLKWVLLFATIIVSIVLFVTSGLLGRVISLPIQRLTQTMKMIEEEGSFEQITITNRTKDEITEMAMTFNRMIIKLEESYAKQEQFVSDASHELRTPLTVIDSYVKLLKRWGKERPDVLEEAIDSIGSEADRMKYLIEQLLQLAKSEETIENEKEVVNIVPIVESTIQRLQQTFAHDIYIKNKQAVIQMKIHEQSFMQLLVILLDNAKKYSDDHIVVELKDRKNSVHISVKDKGVGIPLDAQARIFDRLYRVDKARSRKTGGAGLGLSIAMRIVEQHGGKIAVESMEGKGSTFTIILPH